MDQLYTDLLNVGYDGQSLDKDAFNKVFNKGPPNMYFIDIISWLCSQLNSLCDLESHVSSVDEEDLEAIGFLVEISSLLKELGCPIKKLTSGPVEERLFEPKDKVLAIMYLCQELEAGKILRSKKPQKKETMQIELSESKTAKELREMLISLGFGKPPDNITPQKLFTEVEKKLKMLSQPLSPKDVVGELLFSGYLTEKQWFQLEKLYQEVYTEYKNRRNLLLTRLDVTVRSFFWSDRLKSKAGEIMNKYNKERSGISDEPAVKISDVLAATADLAIVEKTSSASVRKNTKSSVNKVIIPAVPDRGGRPEEQQPPPPEVPSWQKNDSSSRGGRGGQQSSNTYKNMGDRDRDRFQNDNRSSNDNYQRGGNYNNINNNSNSNRGNYSRVSDYSSPAYQPMYQQPIQYCGQMGNPQFGFGGYMPAGDNFQQYGMSDGMNPYQPRPSNQSGHRQRGGYSGERGGRSYRGQGRGRGGRY
ncbi:protein FAM98A-like [Argiope bruennichi]|uniref:Protein FAM98A like protein n=1 Tax=Argiope bruennichi TaxID=94029 RepID=A0A8T0F4S7_ARGBR|nr:protein FAM98A-like [Argiope bruennichi]KAF8784430.1 Protein FAM98A like protein [Argiope bruennichi]